MFKNLTPWQLAGITAPVLVSLAYLLSEPLPPPRKLVIHPAISKLSDDGSELRRLYAEAYPEDFFEGGGYANLPFGKIKYFVLGPEDAPKVSGSDCILFLCRINWCTSG